MSQQDETTGRSQGGDIHVDAPNRVRVVVAGATGFIGKALTAKLVATHDVIGLGRHVPAKSTGDPLTWRACDLFSLRQTEAALAGADVAVYLVHSMMPSAALTQGNFEDLDLICADNFARACERNGIRRIVYLGGLLPASAADAEPRLPDARSTANRPDQLSRHLESRFEVEQALGAHGAAVTTLRAGLVVGSGGSSFDMMLSLVARLPIMFLPKWTNSKTQPIALEDAIALLVFAIEHPELDGRAYDIAGPDVVTYADLLRRTGEVMGRRVRIVALPVRTVKLSLLWVSAITGAPQALVRPLVESLRHDMVAHDGLVLQKRAALVPTPLRSALERATSARAPSKARHGTGASQMSERRACSVQRLPNRAGIDAVTVANEYTAWLPRFFRWFLHVSVDADRTCRFFAKPFRRPLLVLSFADERSSASRQLFFVSGGLLSGHEDHPRERQEGGRPAAKPRLEFRVVLGGAHVLAIVQDFVPSLPWFVYKYTQALVHLLVMRAFARHLARTDRRDRA